MEYYIAINDVKIWLSFSNSKLSLLVGISLELFRFRNASCALNWISTFYFDLWHIKSNVIRVSCSTLSNILLWKSPIIVTFVLGKLQYWCTCMKAGFISCFTLFPNTNHICSLNINNMHIRDTGEGSLDSSLQSWTVRPPG